LKSYIKWGIKILLTLLVIAIVWEGFFVLPDPSRLPNPIWQLEGHQKIETPRLWAKNRLLDPGENVQVTYPPMESILETAASLPAVGWSGMRDRQVASKLACAWVGRGQFKELIDCRPAFLAPTGTQVDWQVNPLPGSSLETAVTVMSQPGEKTVESVEFRVTFLSELSGNIVLFDSIIAAVDPESPPRSWWHQNFVQYLKIEPMANREYWVEVNLDIPQGVTPKGTLRFETFLGRSKRSEESLEVFPFWSEPKLLSPTAPQDPASPNIIYFLVDAMQARLLEDSTLNRVVAPNLTKLKASGVYFRNAISNGNWTRPSLYSLFSSRPHGELGTPMVAYSIAPVERDVFYKTVSRNLVTELKKAGYTTVMLGNNFFLHAATPMGMDQGFDRVWDVERDFYDTVDVTELAIRYLKRNPPKALFLFVNYNAPHYSYKPPPRYSRKVFGRDHGDYRFLANQYLGEVRYADEYLGRVVSALDKLGLRNNTLIVASSDHGEVTRRHPVIRKCADLVSSGTKMVYEHGRSFFDDELRVPLIISLPGRLPEQTEITDQVQLMDVAPTILDLVRGFYPQEFRGKSLMPLIQGDSGGTPMVFSESRNGISLRVENHWKYSRRFPGIQAVWLKTPQGLGVHDLPEELYDLTTDPLETHNLVEVGNPELSELRQMFDANVPGPVWVFRMVLPDSHAVSGEVNLISAPMLTGKIGDVSYSLENTILAFSKPDTGRGEIYWIPYSLTNGGIAKAPEIAGVPLEWGPFAVSGSWSGLSEWSGMIPADLIPDQPAVWFQKNALEMWVATGSGRTPVVGGIREILQDWGYIR
jgi:arylsulfatase A-like enzyme